VTLGDNVIIPACKVGRVLEGAVAAERMGANAGIVNRGRRQGVATAPSREQVQAPTRTGDDEHELSNKSRNFSTQGEKVSDWERSPLPPGTTLQPHVILQLVISGQAVRVIDNGPPQDFLSVSRACHEKEGRLVNTARKPEHTSR